MQRRRLKTSFALTLGSLEQGLPKIPLLLVDLRYRESKESRSDLPDSLEILRRLLSQASLHRSLFKLLIDLAYRLRSLLSYRNANRRPKASKLLRSYLESSLLAFSKSTAFSLLHSLLVSQTHSTMAYNQQCELFSLSLSPFASSGSARV